MKKRIITALLITTASAQALATYPASQPAQAAEVMVRMCQQQRTGIEKNKAISKVYNTVSDWPIASTTEVAAAMDEGWGFAVKNRGTKCDRIYPVMIDMLASKKH
ncbi:hypothetical protein K9H60_06220 [Escherichia coli]|mgnify:FL=1|uniref:Uncharacterized protein n=1 Tax=Enterobacter asburiae TaxID=61645 RepID=A0A7W3DIC2_ENTAS|nr:MULTISPECIES: hypothetical protein [Enterobacteriaceae]EGI4477924.1 hypothetical protein [Escherichia coli]EIP0431214.1 hypothetical protein [Escherichia coli]EKK4936715.1 hypothetical protein [Escherichia coli]MBA8079348.1 hypothetical protein [Enterobacter asburiae]MCZ9398836.1 hypothetical protein [Escherichia coli]